MRSRSSRRALRWARLVYDVMLRAYPSTFRREFGREMALTFESRARDVVQTGGRWALVRFMLHIACDWIHTVVRERKDAATGGGDALARIGASSMFAVKADVDRQSRAVSLIAAALGVFLLVFGWAEWLHAQPSTAAAAKPAFDVASVKPSKAVDARRGGALQPGRFSQTNVTLAQLIQMAYAARGSQIVGASNWIDADRFDIDAKGPFGLSGFLTAADGSPPAVYLMLRTLLEERFKLQIHHETRELPVYALEIARIDGRLGPRLRRSDVDCAALMATIASGGPRPGPPAQPGQAPICGTLGAPGRIMANGVSMSGLSDMLSRVVDRPVLDRTNLAGDFVLELQWTSDPTFPPPDPSGSAASTSGGDLPSIFTAVQEQLGLKLESSRSPVDVLVIDRAEHPTED